MQGPKPSDWKAFGSFIRERRNALGLSAQDVGDALGSSAVFVYKLETGERPLPEKNRAKKVEILAEILECDAEDLKILIPPRRPLADTLRQARANKAAVDTMKVRASELEREDQARRDGLIAQQQLARAAFIDPFAEVAWRVTGLDAGLGDEVPEQLLGSFAWDERRHQQWKVVADALGTMAGTTAAGTALGGAAALGLYAGVAALGTASTGTAIAGLSGAAATSATLAALGGGSLAAGGWGVVGGTALLASVAAIPAVVALGVGTLVADRYAYGKLLEQSVTLDAATKELDEIESGLHVRWDWAERQNRILVTILTAVARPMMLVARELPPEPKKVPWPDLSHSTQQRIQFLALALTLSIEALSLPTWTPNDEGNAVFEERRFFDERYTQVEDSANSLLEQAPG